MAAILAELQESKSYASGILLHQMKIKTETLAGLFIPIALLSEFYYIPVFEGYLRPIHIISPLVIVFFAAHLRKLFFSPLFIIMLALIAVNLISSLMSDMPLAAFTSLLLLVANALIAISTAVLLASGRVSLNKIISLFAYSLIVSVIWGVIQIVVFSVFNINLGMSDSQASQISAGFSPGFRTEANTLAKFINISVLLTLPVFLSIKKGYAFEVFAAIVSIGLLISFTRSVIYTLPLTLFLIFIWHQFSGTGRLMTRRPVILACVFIGSLLIFTVFVSSINEYAAFKIANIFNTEEVLRGDSSGLRLEWLMALVASFTGSLNGFLLGSGWGQIYYHFNDIEMQPGGADILVFAAYGGVFSGLLYFLLIIVALNSSSKMSKRTRGTRESLFYQGIFFALLGLTVTGLLSGSLNAPEYWIVIGLAIFVSKQYRSRSARL